MNTFNSFDGVRIAYHDEGEGPAVILLHGFGVDGLGQFGDFERILPILENEKRRFEKCLGERLRYPIPLARKTWRGAGTTGRRCAHHPSGHVRFRSFRQT
jgi:pimeloyl-ACP methyl ester carboxylesterase